MANKGKWLGMLVLVLVFGMTVVGVACTTSSNVKKAATIDELTNLRDKLTWLNANAQSGGNYLIEIDADSSHGSLLPGYAINLSFRNKSDIIITLKGIGEHRYISTYQKRGIIQIGSGVTLVLDDNIVIKGVSEGNLIDKLTSAVLISNGGTLIMNEGSCIGSNISFTDGGGVYVSNGGTFIMNGGLINSNTCFQPQDQALIMATGGEANAFSESPRRGGGVFVDVGGIFTKTGGTITGHESEPEYGNVTKTFNGISVSQNNGHAVFAAIGRPSSGILASVITDSKRKETTAGPDDNLHIDSDGMFSGNWDF